MAIAVELPKAVREKLGDNGSGELVDFLNIFFDQKSKEIIEKEFHVYRLFCNRQSGKLQTKN